MAKKQFNNFQWDGEFQSKPKHSPKPGKQSSSGKPSGKPAAQHPQNKPAPPKMGASSQPAAQPAPTPASPRGGKPNSRYKPQLRALPVEMYVAAAGNPLAQSLLMALQHEGKPEGMSNEKFLRRFAKYGWNKAQSTEAQEVLTLWGSKQKAQNPRKGFPVLQTPTLEPTGTPQPEFVNPCQDKTGDELIQCYHSALAAYGIGIMNENDLAVSEVSGKVGSLENFTAEELSIILEGVYFTGQKLAGYVSSIIGRPTTSEEAFQLIYGSIEFGYDIDQISGSTIATLDPSQRENTIYILLDDSSFGLSPTDSEIGFRSLPDSFVVVHELGHALANRINNPETDTTSFVDATGSIWNPERVAVSMDIDPTTAQLYDWKPDPTIPGNYLVPPETYIGLGFSAGTREQLRNQFRNELVVGLNPEEGFADTFAHFVLDPLNLENWSRTRFNYFEDNIEDWLREIYSSE